MKYNDGAIKSMSQQEQEAVARRMMPFLLAAHLEYVRGQLITRGNDTFADEIATLRAYCENHGLHNTHASVRAFFQKADAYAPAYSIDGDGQG